MYKKNSKFLNNIKVGVLKLFLFFLFFAFLINNFINNFTITAIIFRLSFFIIILVSIKDLLESKYTILKITCFIFICLLLLRAFIDKGSLYQRFNGFNFWIYFSILLFMQYLIVDIKSLKEIISRIYFYGVFFCSLGIIQFCFRGKLIPQLSTYAKTPIFGYSENNFIRANGILGTPIDFGFITLIFYTLFLQKFIQSKNKFDFFRLLIAFFSCIVTFSRASYLGIVVSTIVICFASVKNRQIRFNSINVSLIIFLILTLTIAMIPNIEKIESSFIISSMLNGKNSNIESSNLIHNQLILQSKYYINQNRLIGYGIGSQMDNATYNEIGFRNTDGTFYSMALEIGIPITVLFISIIIISIIEMLKCYKISIYTKPMCITFIILGIYQILFAGFINSSFISRCGYILYFMLFGLVLAEKRNLIK